MRTGTGDGARLDRGVSMRFAAGVGALGGGRSDECREDGGEPWMKVKS
jgi:hypothetical protein